MGDKLKIVSFNCKGLKGATKREDVLTWLKSKGHNIVLLQESHYEDIDFNDWKEKWGGIVTASSGKNNARGVTTLISKDLECSIVSTYKDKDGRWLITICDIEGRIYTIINYYGPNKDNTAHLESLLNKLEGLPKNNIIFGGDFNFVYNTQQDKLGGNPTTNVKCREKLIKWQEEQQLIDIWRKRHPNTREYTWSSNTKPKIYSRLDHILISQHLVCLTRKADIEMGYASDHKCVIWEVLKPKPEKGRGHWKFNTVLMLEENFEKNIQYCIDRTVQENSPCSDRLMWDIMKCNIRRECIKIGVARAKRQHEEERRAQNQIKWLEQEIIRMKVCNEDITNMEHRLDDMKKNLDDIIEEKCRGAALQSKCQNYEHGENATRYFLNMEKHKGDKQSVHLLIDENGKEIRDTKNILEEEIKYYGRLYSEQPTSKDGYINREENWLFSQEIPKLENDEWPGLTKKIEEGEIEKIIKNSPSMKSPGMDGFPNEFYKQLWPMLKDYMMAAYEEALEEGEMCISQRRGVISLLPKEGKDLRFLKNWRPLTLLNNDYKFLAKLIANRCKVVLPHIISTNQNGFVPGRFIGANIIRTLDILETCNEDQIEGLLINIDIEKAFDSVSWDFMYKALKSFNFPDEFVNMIRCLYNNLEICTMNNGNSSRFEKVGRGMRQGCPLSPLLFVIVIELMNIYIMNNEKLQGIRIGQMEHLISQFADDTSFFLKNEKGMLDRLFTALQNFGRMTGLKLNVSKTEILPIGNISTASIPTNYRKLVKEKVKSLGIWILKSLKDTVKENYNIGKEKLQNSLEFWNKKPLSLVGKINMLKCQIIPKLSYYMATLPDPGREYWFEINQLLFKFISNGKQEKLKRNTVINKFSKGGGQMIDLESQAIALRAMWMIRAAKASGPWTAGLQHRLGEIRLQDFIECNLKKKDIPFKNLENSIWRDILLSWCEVNFKDNIESPHDLVNESIWYNSNIKIAGKVLWKSNWWNEGIHLVWDLLDDSKRKMISYREFNRKFKTPTHFLEIGGIKKAIPGSWKREIRNSQEKPDLTKAEVSLASKCIQNKGSKRLYGILVSRKATGPETKLEQWKDELEVDISTVEILKTMIRVRKYLIYSKLQSFHYNYWNRNLTYGSRLKNMERQDENLCQYCNKKESIKHLYWECPTTKALWTTIAEKFILEETLEMEPEIFLLHQLKGNYTEEIRTLISTVNTACAYYIHLCRCNSSRPTSFGLLNYIKRMKKLELVIAMEKGLLEKYRAKWSHIDV
jgi:exonuclease III